MTAGSIFNRWSLLAGILLIIIIVGVIVIVSHQSGNKPIEITMPTAPIIEGEIYIGGEVNNPGIYPFYPGDSIEDILRASGGVTGSADLTRIELNVSEKGQAAELQKININTADTWLLAALPGIGDVRAGAIVAYRHENGPFRDVNELLNVEGIGVVTLDSIRELITVGD